MKGGEQVTSDPTFLCNRQHGFSYLQYIIQGKHMVPNEIKRRKRKEKKKETKKCNISRDKKKPTYRNKSLAMKNVEEKGVLNRKN